MDERIKELEKIIEAKDKTFREFYEKTQKAHELHIKKVFELMETIKAKDATIAEAREIFEKIKIVDFTSYTERLIDDWLESNK